MITNNTEEILELNTPTKNFRLNNFVSLVENSEEASANDISDVNLDLIIDQIAIAMNKIANLQYKGHAFIEPSEVENVKKYILTDEKCNKGTRARLEYELSKFQDHILDNYKKLIADCRTKQINCEAQMANLETARQQLAMKKSPILWLFDEKRKAYNQAIATLKIRAERYSQKMEDLESMRPAANEKDILLFQVQLRQKFVA